MTMKSTLWVIGGILALVSALAPRPAPAAEGPFVVNCYNEALGTVQKSLAGDCKGKVVDDDEAEAIHEKRRDRIRGVLAKPSRPQVQGRRLAGVGSGFFVAADGSLITNHHVVDDCAVVTITPTEGKMVAATQVITADDSDLALLRSALAPPAVATFATVPTERLARGPASLIGYPNLGLVAIEPILTSVKVVERRTSASQQPVIVLEGKVRSGNSGGPLLDSGGLVIGVVFARVNTVGVYETTGKTVRNVGLAISRETVVAFLEDQGVDYRSQRPLPSRAQSLVLSDAKPYLAQIGCWR